MADPSNDEKLDKGKLTQTIDGQHTDGESAIGQAQPGSGSMPRRSMGTRGTEFGQFADATGPDGQQGQSGTGQADLGSQAGSTLAGRADQQELGEAGGDVDQPASYGEGVGARQSTTEGEGFILQQGSGADDLQQRGGSAAGSTSPSSAEATAGSDFAKQGRGALEDENEAGVDDSA
jgi:hypothetical protein